MKINIEKRKLSDKEIDFLTEEVRKFPNPVVANKKRYKEFSPVYTAKINNNLIGVCAVIKLKDWLKLGPFVILKKYQGKGYGKMILKEIAEDYSNENLFIGSRNPAVVKIATGLGFEEISNFFSLPSTIKLYLVQNIFSSLSSDYFRELRRKGSVREGPYRYFVRLKKV